MKVKITVDVEDEHADPDDRTGLTAEAYDRLTDPMHLPLGWLGEINEVEAVTETRSSVGSTTTPKRPKP